MKKEVSATSLIIVTIIMVSFVFLIANHYKNEVKKLDARVKRLEIILNKK